MPVTAKQNIPVKPDGDMWLHVTETALLTGGLTFAAIIVAHATGVHSWAIALAELLIAAIITCSALVHTSSVAVAVYLGTWGVFLPVWTLIAGSAGVLNHLVWSSLLVAVGFLIPRGAYVFAREHAHLQAQANKRLEIESSQEKTGWQNTFARLGASGVKVDDITRTRAGSDVHLLLPSKGDVTFETIRELQGRIETSRKLKRGAIRFSEGEHGHEVTMHVTTREVLKETVDYALDWLDQPIDHSINDPFEVGLYENGEPVLIKFRDIAGLVLGVRRSGKSNFMNVFIAELARCWDVVIFMIDAKGGQAASAWLQPWVNGECDRPVLDWVATDRDEAKIMLDTLLQWIDIRARRNVGKEKITPSHGQPAIVLIVDELSEIAGQNGPKAELGHATNYQLASLLDRLAALGGSAAIDPLAGTQRGTVTKVGSGDFKSQCELRIGTGAINAADASYIFKDHRAAALLTRISRIPGAALVELGDEPSAPLKVFRLDPERGDIHRIAAHAGDFRTEPEPALIAAAGSAYAERWERPSQREYLQQIRNGTLPKGDDDDRFWEIVEPGDGHGPGPVRANPARQIMRDLIAQSGLVGETPYSLGRKLEAAGQKVSQKSIHTWLNKDVEDGLFVVLHPGTQKVRYLSREKGRQMGATGTDG